MVWLESRRRGRTHQSLGQLVARYAVPGGRLSLLTPDRIYSRPQQVQVQGQPEEEDTEQQGEGNGQGESEGSSNESR